MPFKRHSALYDLTRDHQRFLSEARHIRWLVGKDPRAATLSEVRQSLLTFWQESAIPHMRQEEEVLLPFCQHHNPDLLPEIEHILADHQWLRERFAVLEKNGEDRILMAKIAQKIHEHIYHEERSVLSYLRNYVAEADLEQLQSALQEVRQPATLG